MRALFRTRDRRTAVARLSLLFGALCALIAAIAVTLDVQPHTRADLITGIALGICALGLFGTFLAALVMDSDVQPTNTILTLPWPHDAHQLQLSEGSDCMLAGTFSLGLSTIVCIPIAFHTLGSLLPNQTCAVAVGFWLSCLVTLLVVRATGPRRLELHPEGMLLEGPWLRRWIPFVAIQKSQSDPAQLRLTLARGELFSVRWHELDQRRRGFVSDYLARQKSNPMLPSPELLERLRAVALAGVAPATTADFVNSYRELATDLPSAILAALEDPQQPDDVRFGAALTLKAADDPRLRQRLRDCARTLPRGKLRAALRAG